MNKNITIKLCGFRDAETAQKSVLMGADLIGLIFYKKSKRYIEPQLGKTIAHAVKNVGGTPVAVFVDAAAEEMKTISDYCDIETIQLHGPISRTQHHLLPKTYRKIYVKPMNSAGKIIDENDQNQKLDPSQDQLLFDHFQSGQGFSFDLNQFNYEGPFSYFLAGGLTPNTVKNAIQLTHPNGVDVSSGIEINGTKDLSLIADFIQAVRA